MLLRQAEVFAGIIDELGSALAVSLGSACDFRNAFADQGFGNDDLGSSIVIGLRVAQCLGNRHKIMTVNGHGIPSLRAEVCLRILALGHFCHGIESDIVGIIN